MDHGTCPFMGFSVHPTIHETANVFLMMETPKNSEFYYCLVAEPAVSVLHVKIFVNTLVQGLECYGLRQYFNYALTCTLF